MNKKEKQTYIIVGLLAILLLAFFMGWFSLPTGEEPGVVLLDEATCKEIFANLQNGQYYGPQLYEISACCWREDDGIVSCLDVDSPEALAMTVEGSTTPFDAVIIFADVVNLGSQGGVVMDVELTNVQAVPADSGDSGDIAFATAAQPSFVKNTYVGWAGGAGNIGEYLDEDGDIQTYYGFDNTQIYGPVGDVRGQHLDDMQPTCCQLPNPQDLWCNVDSDCGTECGSGDDDPCTCRDDVHFCEYYTGDSCTAAGGTWDHDCQVIWATVIWLDGTAPNNIPESFGGGTLELQTEITAHDPTERLDDVTTPLNRQLTVGQANLAFSYDVQYGFG